jgi:NAD(P)-dependent dehydrogenase (short-subunit alcohol dehydrogenase family)
MVRTELDGRLAGEVVMITGASRGLGRELARAFALEGAAVSVCARSGGELDDLRRDLARYALSIQTSVVDVTEEEEVLRWVAEVERALGTPTVLVNNASVLGSRVPLSRYDLAEWRRTLEVNLTGSFIVARSVLPSMQRAGSGCIIQLSSGAAVPPRKEWGAYAVSKLAADGLALNLAAELEGTGIRVNAVDPGAMRTEMRADAYPEEDPTSLEPPSARTRIFLWLASPAAAAVTGQRLRAADWKAEAMED